MAGKEKIVESFAPHTLRIERRNEVMRDLLAPDGTVLLNIGEEPGRHLLSWTIEHWRVIGAPEDIATVTGPDVQLLCVGDSPSADARSGQSCCRLDLCYSRHWYSQDDRFDLAGSTYRLKSIGWNWNSFELIEGTTTLAVLDRVFTSGLFSYWRGDWEIQIGHAGAHRLLSSNTGSPTAVLIYALLAAEEKVRRAKDRRRQRRRRRM